MKIELVRHSKHKTYKRWWPGVLKKKRLARKQRLDNWTLAMWRGLVGRKSDEEMGIVTQP
jgi:hypothetical protein